MSLRLVEVRYRASHEDTVQAVVDDCGAVDHTRIEADADHRVVRVLIRRSLAQSLVDRLQTALGGTDDWRINILPVEATVPAAGETEETARVEAARASASRDELYHDVEGGARLGRTFIILVILSSIVTAIGLVTDQVAVLIGAMVIAPLLGPLLAFALGAALGDVALMRKALLTNSVGVAITIAAGVWTALLLPDAGAGAELLARSDVGIASVVLALASGGAAALSLTTGLSATLVGVMVAVALMPPAVALGMFAGWGDVTHATGAALLLAVNIVCFNLATQATLVLRGVRPRTWAEQKGARVSVRLNLVVWLASLAALATLIWLYQ